MVKRIFWLFGIVIFLLILFLPGYTRLQELRDKDEALQKRIKQLSIENTLLQQELQDIENDPVYQEKVARDKMGVVRKGEIPLRLVPDDGSQPKNDGAAD